jgi:hypothetical protein
MVSGLFETLRKLPNPAEANAILREVNILIEHLNKIPPEKIRDVIGLLDDIIALQKLNPSVEPLKMAVEMVTQINLCDMNKIAEIRGIIKEAAKLPLSELVKS